MDRQSESFAKFFCRRNRERGTRRNAKAKLRHRLDIFHFAKRLIEDRHTGKDSRVRLGEILKDRAWSSVLTQNRRYPARDQRRQQIAESVGMGNRNDAEVKIDIG